MSKVFELEDMEADRRMFRDTIHEAIHQSLINQSEVFMNTVRNVIRDGMNCTLAQEQIIGSAYFNTQTSAGGSSKRPIDETKAINSPRTGTKSTVNKSFWTTDCTCNTSCHKGL